MAIMIPTVLRNCTRRPKTRLYPVEERQLFPKTRGQIKFELDKCIFCTLCAKRCPTNAISVDRKEKILVFDPFRCIVCEACIEGCAKDAFTLVEKWRSPNTQKYTEVFKGQIIAVNESENCDLQE